jgi:hypothetical protein
MSQTPIRQRLLGGYDRVRHLHQQNFSPEQIAYSLGCSLKLVQQYLDIHQQLQKENDHA